MIASNVQLTPGMKVVHDEGLTYEIEDFRLSTQGYEETHELGTSVVNYVQLQDGGYPAGTKWSKDEDGFRCHFTVAN